MEPVRSYKHYNHEIIDDLVSRYGNNWELISYDYTKITGSIVDANKMHDAHRAKKNYKRRNTENINDMPIKKRKINEISDMVAIIHNFIIDITNTDMKCSLEEASNLVLAANELRLVSNNLYLKNIY